MKSNNFNDNHFTSKKVIKELKEINENLLTTKVHSKDRKIWKPAKVMFGKNI